MNEEVEISYTLSERDGDGNNVFFAQSGPAVITVIDDDIGIIISNNHSTDHQEGTSRVETYRLNKNPQENVQFLFTNYDTSIEFNPVMLNFTSTNWDTAQNVTVTADADSDETDNVTTADWVVRRAVSPFTQLSTGTLSWNILDEGAAARSPGTPEPETPTLPPGFVLVNFPETVTIGSVASFTLALEEQPTEDITVTVTSSDPNEIYIAKTSYTFTSGTWSTPAAGGLLGYPTATSGTEVTVTFSATGGQYEGVEIEYTVTVE